MKRLGIALAALCVLALSLTGLSLMVRAQRQQAALRRFADAGPANLAREEAAARRLGVPLTPAALQAPLPPAEQNAAPLYVKLTTLLHDKPLGLPKYAEGMDAFHAYTPAQVAAVRQILAARPDVTALVHQAADRPKCVFARDWSLGTKLEFPEFQPMREAARLLKTESYLLARDGHYKEAITNQVRGFRVAEHAASDHLLISYLVGVACESLTLNGMQSILTLAGPNAAVNAAVQQIVSARQSRLSLRRAMAGETGFDCLIFGPMHGAEKNGVEAVIVAAGFTEEYARKAQEAPADRQRLHNLIDAWQADYLSRMCPIVTASDQPPLVRRAAYEAAGRQVESDSRRLDTLAFLFSEGLIPIFSKIDQNSTRTAARVAVTQAAAVLLAEKARTGVYPDALPTGFTDPFTSEPLGYKREGTNGFVVYSAGPTAAFDGGKAGQKVPGQESIFRYPAVTVAD